MDVMMASHTRITFTCPSFAFLSERWVRVRAFKPPPLPPRNLLKYRMKDTLIKYSGGTDTVWRWVRVMLVISKPDFMAHEISSPFAPPPPPEGVTHGGRSDSDPNPPPPPGRSKVLRRSGPHLAQTWHRRRRKFSWHKVGG